jgi:hypothetical protein
LLTSPCSSSPSSKGISYCKTHSNSHVNVFFRTLLLPVSRTVTLSPTYTITSDKYT